MFLALPGTFKAFKPRDERPLGERSDLLDGERSRGTGRMPSLLHSDSSLESWRVTSF